MRSALNMVTVNVAGTNFEKPTKELANALLSGTQASQNSGSTRKRYHLSVLGYFSSAFLEAMNSWGARHPALCSDRLTRDLSHNTWTKRAEALTSQELLQVFEGYRSCAGTPSTQVTPSSNSKRVAVNPWPLHQGYEPAASKEGLT